MSPVQTSSPRFTAALLPPRCVTRITSSTNPSPRSSCATSAIPSVEPSSTTTTCKRLRSLRVCSAKPLTQARRDRASLCPAKITLTVRLVSGGCLGRSERTAMAAAIAPIIYRGPSSSTEYQNSSTRLTKSSEPRNAAASIGLTRELAARRRVRPRQWTPRSPRERPPRLRPAS